jgi:uncharacterized protein YcfJ
MNVAGPGKAVIAGAVFGFIAGGFVGGLIDHQFFYGFVSVILGALGAAIFGFIGYKIGQSNI